MARTLPAARRRDTASALLTTLIVSAPAIKRCRPPESAERHGAVFHVKHLNLAGVPSEERRTAIKQSRMNLP
jgi:hypothetical protein